MGTHQAPTPAQRKARFVPCDASSPPARRFLGAAVAGSANAETARHRRTKFLNSQQLPLTVPAASGRAPSNHSMRPRAGPFFMSNNRNYIDCNQCVTIISCD
jgi:hypothetical protein